MIVRSPRNKAAPRQDAPDWPPKSPFHALLSSPSGRKKWQDSRSNADRSTSPSSARKHVSESQRALPSAAALVSDEEAEMDIDASLDALDGDDDEETLELKLQEIQTRLRIKKAQAKKRKGIVPNQTKAPVDSEPGPERHSKRRKVHEAVLVPVSPPRRNQPAAPVQRSPARVLLGLENRASDVSLKRASSSAAAHSSRSHPSREIPKIKSFSERMAEGRAKDQAQQERDDRIRLARSAAFDVNPSIRLERRYQAHESAQSVKKTAPAHSQRLTKAISSPITSTTSQHSDQNVPESEGSFDLYSSLHLSKRHMEHTEVSRILDGKEIYTLPRLLKSVKSPEYEPPDCETDYVVLGILASKSSPYDIKGAARPTTSADMDKDNDADTNRMVESRKFMVLKLVDLEWELDLFLFGHAFREHWKLTPGTLLAVLNPEIMPPKVKTASGRFSLKLNSSEDRVLEIGVARDLGYCKSVKRDGATCNAWVNRRKTEFCDYHVNMMLEKTRAGRMEVNGMARGGRGPGTFSAAAATRVGETGDRPRGGRRKDPETGEWYYAPSASIPALSSTGLNSSPHICKRGPRDEDYSQIGLSTRQIMDISELARPEQMRKRLEAKERERATAIKLGALGNGIGAEYLRLTNGKSGSAATHTGPEPGSASASASGDIFRDGSGRDKRPDASALGLIATSASRTLGSASAGSGTSKRKRDAGTGTRNMSAQVGWGGAFKRGLIDGVKVIGHAPASGELTIPVEKGQKTLRTMVVAAGAGALAVGPVTRVAQEPILSGPPVESVHGSPAIGRVRKRARLDLGDRGIKEPGRESFGQPDRTNNDSEDGDELDIVM